MATGYQINNVDTDLLYVRKEMFLEGNLWGCGYNLQGQLGDNTTTNKSSPVQTVAGGMNWKSATCWSYTAAIKSDGSLWSWGYNPYGGLGDNTTTNKSSPVQTVAGGVNWKSVAGGYRHTAAIKTDGTLWAWGQDTYGQLGDNTTANKSSPVQTVSGGTNWKQVACGFGHTAAIKTDGTLWVCGYNKYGQLGDNSTTNKSSPVQTVAGGANWKVVACGYHHTAAIKTDGTLWTCGYNLTGQLGNNSRVYQSSPVQTIAGGTNWKSVAGGYLHTAAIKTDGTLWMWGYNSSGQLGDSSIVNKSSPVQTVAGGTNWKTVACGTFHTAAIKTDGTLWVCGYNKYGQLGDNTTVNCSIPVQTVAGGTNWLSVMCGRQHTIALIDNIEYDAGIPYIPFMNTPSGTIYSWGDGYGGAIGIVSVNRNTTSPTMTSPSYNNWIQVSGGYSFEAAIKTDGTLWSWGYNAQGRLGQGITGGNINTPTQTVPANLRWADVSCNYTHMSAITISGALYGAGANYYGQLGLNNNTDSNSMSMVFGGGTNWKQTSSGRQHTSSIKADGTLWSCGYNTWGNLGVNDTGHRSSPIQTVAGGTNWWQVACGSNHTMAIKTDGTLWGWGRTADGQVGTNITGNYSSPVQVITGGTNWSMVSCGYTFTAAIKTDGTLWTWGSNGSGQLGDNTTSPKSSPVQTIAGGTNWKQVACGNTWTVAIKNDGTLWTWGNNGTASSGGFLGDNTNVNKSSPVQTAAGGNSWIYVSANMYTTIGIRAEVVGQQMYTTPGTYTWVAPAGVYSVSAVAVGAGGAGDANNPLNAGGGGALSYTNNITVVPGNSYTVTVGAGATYNSVTAGGNSSFSTFVIAGGGQSGASGSSAGGTPITAGVGNSGGSGARGATGTSGAGGGGAGGYSGAGGAGSVGSAAAGAGAGGGAGGGYGQTVGSGGGMAGGGVGLLGRGANGAAGVAGSYVTAGGKGGSNGTDATYSNGSIPGVYGGGQGGGQSSLGGSGAVRIIWPGTTRRFPSTNTWDM